MKSCPAPNAVDKYLAMKTHILYMCEMDGIKPPVVAMGKHRARMDKISPNVIALCVSGEPAYLHARAAYAGWLWTIGEKWNGTSLGDDRDTQRSPEGYRGNWILGMVCGV